jgi:hypothetical protein
VIGTLLVTPVLVNRQFLGSGSVCAGPVGPESESRWSARSEARTYDLDAGEDRRIIEHRVLPKLLGHGGAPRCRNGCRRVRAIRPCLGARALGLGDMTIDRVALRVRDRVNLLRPSSRSDWRAVPIWELVARGPLPSANLPGHVSDISGRLSTPRRTRRRRGHANGGGSGGWACGRR